MKYWYVKNGTVDRPPTSPQSELPPGIDAGIADVQIIGDRIKLLVAFSNHDTLIFEFDANISTLIEDIETSIQYHTDLL